MREFRALSRQRRLTDSEKSLLATYIPAIDLEYAIVHEGRVPWYLPKRFAAITRGRHIYFRCGAYTCGTAAGIALLAHEMVHVGQYREGMTAIKYLWSSRKGYSPESRYERPAYALERRILRDLIDAHRVEAQARKPKAQGNERRHKPITKSLGPGNSRY